MSDQLDDLHISDKNTPCQPGCSRTETSGGHEISSGKCIKAKVSRVSLVNQDNRARFAY